MGGEGAPLYDAISALCSMGYVGLCEAAAKIARSSACAGGATLSPAGTVVAAKKIDVSGKTLPSRTGYEVYGEEAWYGAQQDPWCATDETDPTNRDVRNSETPDAGANILRMGDGSMGAFVDFAVPRGRFDLGGGCRRRPTPRG